LEVAGVAIGRSSPMNGSRYTNGASHEKGEAR
jgi:hypothetical protein